MYEFYYPFDKNNLSDIKKYLIFVKRNLPRWVNSIPDSEFLSLFDISLNKVNRNSAIIETGCGASSLALLVSAIKTDSILFSWDINGSKLEFINNVAFQTIGKNFGVDINKFWKTINFDSTSDELGIKILSEFNKKASFAFLDSYHTLDHIVKEAKLTLDNFVKSGAIFIIVAYYDNKSKNFAFINIMRKKLGLRSIDEPIENKCQPYFEVIEGMLHNHFSEVKNIDNQSLFKDDIFYEYYSLDREAINMVGMELKEKLHNRFKSWSVRR